ncbi:MAG: tRNA-dihydrouridine synthase [Lentisphaerota bacterium]
MITKIYINMLKCMIFFVTWQKVIKNKPFFCLAPMADVTDIAFRQIIAKYSKHGKKGATKHGMSGRGGPDLFWTEFVSADGLASKEGKKRHQLKTYNRLDKGFR